MALKGVDDGYQNPLTRSAFRTSWTIPEGGAPAYIHEARILDVNLTNWTVDCVTVFDGKRFFDIQVASPYLNPSQGEGIYVVPEAGSKCVVCIPSDGPPPFVLAFILPSEAVMDASSDQAPAGTQGGQAITKRPTDSTFSGGRARGKYGDIVMKGRDGNFVILHRGGVLQIGATELAQRICIPIGNLVTDISQNYNHFNSGGSINWGIRASSPEENPETEFKQTFRVYANDETADIRVAVGKVHQTVPEKIGEESSALDLEELNIGKDSPVVFEMVLAPGHGFETDSGTPSSDTRDAVKLKLFFDRAGGAMLRAEGAVSLRIRKKLRLRGDDNLEFFSKKDITMECEDNLRLIGKKTAEISTDGGVLTLNGGTKPVAHVGSQIMITTVVPIPINTSQGPGTILAGAVFSGSVSTGNPTIRV